MDDLGWVAKQSYQFGQYLVAVRTNSEPLAAWLDETFSEYRSTEEIGALYSLLVGEEPDPGRPGQRFNVLHRSSLVLSRERDLRVVVDMLRGEFESFLFADWDEAIYSESVIASHNGTAALLPVVGAARLTDIWRKLDRAGISMPIPGRIAVDPASGELLPIPPRLALPEGALDEVRKMDPHNTRAPRYKPAPEPSPITAVCLPKSRPVGVDDYELLQPVSRAVAVKTLADEQVVNIGPMGPRVLEGFARLTEGTRCYELVHRNADELLEGLLAALSPTPVSPRSTIKDPPRAGDAGARLSAA